VAGQGLYPPQGFRAAVAEIIQHHHLFPCFQQGQTGMAANKSGSAGYQNRHEKNRDRFLIKRSVL
jgi:hypothetical protein